MAGERIIFLGKKLGSIYWNIAPPPGGGGGLRNVKEDGQRKKVLLKERKGPLILYSDKQQKDASQEGYKL